MKNISVTLLLFFSHQFSIAQNDILHYVQRVFPNELNTDIPVSDTNLFQEYNYLEFKNDSYGNFFQAKIYTAKKGNDILFITYLSDDMQCMFSIHKMYEIDREKDSLISIPYLEKIPALTYSEFTDIDYIKKNIYEKYAGSLKNYLGETDAFSQFIEELFNFKIKIEPNGLLWIELLYCDYISRNIIGFTPEEDQYLDNSKGKVMAFRKWRKVFKHSKKKIRVRF